MKKLAATILILAILLCGCASPPAPESTETPAPQTPAPTPSPSEEIVETPAPTPFVTDISGAEDIFLQEWEKAEFSFDLVPGAVITTEESPLMLFMEEDATQRAWLFELETAIVGQLSQAVQTAAQATADYFAMEHKLNAKMTSPTWQFLYAVIHSNAPGVGLSEKLRAAMALELEFENADETLMISATLSPKAYKEAFSSICTDETSEMSARFLYSYIYTAYDEQAQMREYIERKPDGNLLKGIVWPLESHTRLRKTWYADRDDGTRRHMGTDIWAAEDTEIYSCTDGVVTFVGEGSGMGYAVVVEDEYGYEYHYYHMVRLTDFLKKGDKVKAGDLVGHVGNTGNSSRNHLHLTIVAPDGYYINPYPYLEPIEP